jgi:hypothetical protein
MGAELVAVGHLDLVSDAQHPETEKSPVEE